MKIMKPGTADSMTVILPADLAVKLEKLTEATGLDKNAIALLALSEYMEAEAWRIADIEQGIAEADRGDFASASEVSAFFAKYDG
jgi:RHH-type rel operon transcriptional repressor/antitoxin RelB